jgi:hypothetical protein
MISNRCFTVKKDVISCRKVEKDARRLYVCFEFYKKVTTNLMFDQFWYLISSGDTCIRASILLLVLINIDLIFILLVFII